jgi:hypothetical protein
MIARAGSGWQYILADLSLILFMVTAAALASSEDAPARASHVAGSTTSADGQPLSPQGEPLALYRSAPGAPPLAQWLRDQSADARQQLTIVAQYGPGGQVAALGRARDLAEQAGEAGARARIVIEPGQGGTTARLAFDVPDALMARKLQETGRNP